MENKEPYATMPLYNYTLPYDSIHPFYNLVVVCALRTLSHLYVLSMVDVQ